VFWLIEGGGGGVVSCVWLCVFVLCVCRCAGAFVPRRRRRRVSVLGD
jgi:hypothetical protein